MKKLHVPAPGQKHEDPLALYDVLSVSIAICLFLAIGAAILLSTSVDKTTRTTKTQLTFSENTVDFDAVEQSLQQFESLGPEKLRQFPWTPTTAAAAWEYGSRDAAEAACEHFAPGLIRNDLDPALVNSLVQSLDRYAMNAPWTCLSRLLLNQQLPQNTPLHTILENTWQSIEAFEDHGPIAASVLENFRATRNRPESPRFYRWLRLCAFNFTEDARTSYPAAMECHNLLNQISPEQGEDFIMAADRIWSDSPSKAERHTVIRAFTILAKKGQPYAWRTDETTALPDYNTDFKLGVVFSLCRILHSPDDSDAREAAVAVASIAGSSVRPADENLFYRWRKTCRFAFLDKDASPDDEIPLFNVTVPSAEQAVDEIPLDEIPASEIPAEKPPVQQQAHDYSLAKPIERGECARYEDKPDWYCGAERWRGGKKSIADALGDWYNETRYVEWRD